ncbi:MAG: hypothetical protein AAGC43_02100 [Bacteroidota bacterium]
MHKKLKLIALLFVLLQSCQVYRPVTINKIEKGKNYKITHSNGQTFNAQCQDIRTDTISVIVNKKKMELPKSKIEKVEKQKVPVLRLIGGLGLATAASILIIKNGDKETFIEQVVER